MESFPYYLMGWLLVMQSQSDQYPQTTGSRSNTLHNEWLSISVRGYFYTVLVRLESVSGFKTQLSNVLYTYLYAIYDYLVYINCLKSPA